MNDTIPDVLQQVSLHLIHHFDSICANVISDPTVHFCVGLCEGGKGNFRGPIFQWTGDRWEQVGVASYVGKGGYTTVYTRISYFHDWITSHIRDNTMINHRVLYQCSMLFQQCGCSRRSVALSPSDMVKSETALAHSWSMMVSIRVAATDQHLCSGTVFDDLYVLTTAHCLADRSAQDITIKGGMYSQSESSAKIRQVKRIFIHPDYTVHSNAFINDIAILQVTQPFNTTEYDSFIVRSCLPSEADSSTDSNIYPSNGTRLAISGWDIPSRLGSVKSPVLRQAEIYVIDDEELNCSLSNSQHLHQFCAGRYEHDEGICNEEDNFGDPIFQWQGSRWIQVGLGSRCGMSGKLGVFTNLATYLDWIELMLYYSAENSSHLYQCDRKTACGCGQTDVNLTISGVTGGETAVERSWPMVVSIRFEDSHLCGGTILSEWFILTSASCVNFVSDNSRNIVAGIDTLSEPIAIRRYIDQIYFHPNYSHWAYVHDVAIIRLDQPLPVGNTSSILAKTCLPAHSISLIDDDLKPNASLAVVGWDHSGLENKFSDALQQLSVRMLNHTDSACHSFTFDNTYHFCAGLKGFTQNLKMKYLCNGAIGGPVLIFKDDHWEQVGIIPFGYSCANIRRGETFTRLSPYLEWMENVTNSSLTISSTPSPEQTGNVMNFSTTILSSTSKNSAINNQGHNNLIFAVYSLLIGVFLM